MDLALKSTLSAPAALEVFDSGPLTEGDMVLRGLPAVEKAPDLVRVSDRHHLLARALANGIEVVDAAAMYGYSPGTIYRLRGTRAFQDLVAHYRRTVEIKFADYQERMASLGADAMSELHKRLEENPEDLSTGQLISILEKMADRTGHSPVQRSQSHHIHENIASRLDAARRRVAERVKETPEEESE